MFHISNMNLSVLGGAKDSSLMPPKLKSPSELKFFYPP